MPTAVLCTQHHGLLVYDGNVMTTVRPIAVLFMEPLLCSGLNGKMPSRSHGFDDHLYNAILRSLGQTHCAHLWFYMSDKLFFIACFLNIH